MASVMEIVVSAQDQASEVLDGIADRADNLGSTFQDNLGRAAIAGAAAGAASEGYARSQQDATLAAERLGRAQGMTSDEVRELASDMQNATFPIDDVLGLMELGSQRGLEGGDALRDYAEFWDMVGDATGESAQQLAQSGVALQRLGIDAGNEEEALAALGFVTESTTSDVDGFLTMVDRAGRELGENTPPVDDMAAALGALEDEGISGARGQRELQQALRETEGDMDAALDLLGVSKEAFDDQREAVAASGDVIQSNADDYAELRTPLQNIQASVENLMFKYGDLAEVAAMAAPVLMAVGPIMSGVTVATRALSAGMAFLAANPIVLVIAAVAALVAGLVIAYQRSETFRNIVDGVFTAVADAGRWMWERVLQPAFDAMRAHFDIIMGVAETFGGVWQRVMEAGGKAVDLLTLPFRTGLNLLAAGVEGVVNAVARAINRMPTFDIPNWVPAIGGGSFGLPTIAEVSLPRFHSGGLFRAPAGRTEGLALLRDRERVTTPEQESEMVGLLRQMVGLLERGTVLEVDGQVLAAANRRATGRMQARNLDVRLA